MSVVFRKPAGRVDWRNLAGSLLPAGSGALSLMALATGAAAPWALAAGAAGFHAAAHKAIRDASEAARPEHGVDERAWVWLPVSVTVATFALLGARATCTHRSTPTRRRRRRGNSWRRRSISPTAPHSSRQCW